MTTLFFDPILWLQDLWACKRPPLRPQSRILDIATLNRRCRDLDRMDHHSDAWLADHGTRRDRLTRDAFADLFDL